MDKKKLQTKEDFQDLNERKQGESPIHKLNRIYAVLSTINQAIVRIHVETVEELRQTQLDRNVEFIIQKGIQAKGDDRLLRIVFDNLLGNAWKFTSNHPNARIEFGLLSEKETAVYFVRDDGAGFDMKYSDKLFSCFQRLHNTTEFPGTGVGLATLQRVIHRHGGKVWAESKVEKGAIIYFTIP